MTKGFSFQNVFVAFWYIFKCYHTRDAMSHTKHHHWHDAVVRKIVRKRLWLINLSGHLFATAERNSSPFTPFKVRHSSFIFSETAAVFTPAGNKNRRSGRLDVSVAAVHIMLWLPITSPDNQTATPTHRTTPLTATQWVLLCLLLESPRSTTPFDVSAASHLDHL